MKEEVDVFGFKFEKDAIFDEENNLKVLGCFLIVVISMAFLKWCSEHPDKLKEIVYG